MAFKKHNKKKQAELPQVPALPTPEALQSQITQEGQKIQDIYTQIGKRYAALHRQDPPAEFGPEVAAIVRSEAKVLELWKQLLDLKGLIRCAVCGAEIANNSVFCPFCGTPTKEIPQPKPERKPLCPGCGVELTEEMRFCIRCGRPVQPEDLIVPEEPEICKQCAIDAAKGLQFCTTCGKSVIPESPAEEVAAEEILSSEPVILPLEEPPEEIQEEAPVLSSAQEAEQAAETEAAPASSAPDQGEAPAKRICSICDAELPEGMLFCTVCGTKY